MKINKDKTGKYRELGERVFQAIKYARLDHETYRVLAPRFGVTPPVVGRLIHGQQSACFQTLSNIAKVTKVHTHWLVTGDGDMVLPGYDEGYYVEEDVIRCPGLTPEQKVILKKLIKEFQQGNK